MPDSPDAGTPPAVEDRLREALLASGRTPTQLAGAVGLSVTVVSHFLRSERSLSLPAFSKFCRLLGLDLLPAGSTPPAEPRPCPADLLPRPKRGRPRKPPG